MREVAEALARALGGLENLVEVQDCMTRVRARVRDAARVDVKAIQGLPGVMRVTVEGSEAQVVLGPGKTQKVTHELQNMLRR